MNTKTKNMVGVALFTAIVVVLQFLGGGIRVGGMFSISLVLVPIVVGAAVYGWQAGAWLGFAFGVAVLLSGDAAAFLVIDFMATIFVVLLKGTACGFVAGLAYKALSGKGNHLAVYTAAILCPVWVIPGVFCWVVSASSWRLLPNVARHWDLKMFMLTCSWVWLVLTSSLKLLSISYWHP